MNRCIPAFLLLFFCSPFAYSVYAQVRHIGVGQAPAAVFADPDNNEIHVLTAGVDKDFDGVLEVSEGDEAPRWYVIDAVTESVIDSVVFTDYFNSFPIRPGVDVAGGRLFLPQLGRVRQFGLHTRMLVKDTVVNGAYAAASFDPVTGVLLLAERVGFTSPGYIVGVNPDNGALLGRAETGANPGQAVALADARIVGPGVYVLNEGVFGAGDATISYYGGNPAIYQAKNGEELGGGASYITTKGNLAYIVLGNSGQIRIINTETNLEEGVSPITTGVGGFDGPRTLAFHGDNELLVGTYSSDLRRFNLNTGEMIDSLLLPGKVEAVAVRDSLAYALIKYTAGTYNADSLLVVVNLNQWQVVDTIITGEDPGALVVDNSGNLHVFGYGSALVEQDNWWIVYDAVTREPVKNSTFAGSLGFPLRVGYNADDEKLYIAVSDTVFEATYNASVPLSDFRPVYVDTTATGSLTGVADGGKYLLVNELPKNFSPSPGTVHVVDKADGHTVATFLAGPFLSMATPVTTAREGAYGVYALNEGTFGAPSSTLTLFEYQPNILSGGSEMLGDVGNHIVSLGGNRAAVTMNGSHEVVLIDLQQGVVEGRISTGTASADGPREVVPYGAGLIVSTYSGDVRLLSTSGSGYLAIPIDAKGEGLAVVGEKVFVAGIYQAGTYSPGSRVAVLDVSTLSIRREDEDIVATETALEQNYPNPATGRTSIRFNLSEPVYATLTLYSAEGAQVATVVQEQLEARAYTAEFDTQGLPSGTYVYTLRANGLVQAKTMQVVQ